MLQIYKRSVWIAVWIVFTTHAATAHLIFLAWLRGMHLCMQTPDFSVFERLPNIVGHSFTATLSLCSLKCLHLCPCTEYVLDLKLEIVILLTSIEDLCFEFLIVSKLCFSLPSLKFFHSNIFTLSILSTAACNP